MVRLQNYTEATLVGLPPLRPSQAGEASILTPTTSGSSFNSPQFLGLQSEAWDSPIRRSEDTAASPCLEADAEAARAASMKLVQPPGSPDEEKALIEKVLLESKPEADRKAAAARQAELKEEEELQAVLRLSKVRLDTTLCTILIYGFALCLK